MSQNMSDHSDDSFQLYDLRVEVVCPPNERVLCGAKPGDHFMLQGEMLYFPPGQGFSIYSLSKCTNHVTRAWSVVPLLTVPRKFRCCPPAPGGQAACDSSA